MECPLATICCKFQRLCQALVVLTRTAKRGISKLSPSQKRLQEMFGIIDWAAEERQGLEEAEARVPIAQPLLGRQSLRDLNPKA